ncbi:MAG: NAD(P)/FAD-dependent oxidoreductase [Planctomycetota bacterium]
MSDFQVKPLKIETDFNALPYWDVVIIGAGPAGLAASLTTAHRGLTTLVIEAKEKPGGQPQFLYSDKRIIDIPGFPDGITGAELSSRVYRQAREALVQFRFEEELRTIEDTQQIEKEDPLKKVLTNKNTYLCRKVIIAVGLLHFPRKLPVLDALNSKKIYYKMPKISDYSGQRVAIVGGGDSALDAAVMILERNGHVEQIIRADAPAGKIDTFERVCHSGGNIHTRCEIQAASFSGDGLNLKLSTGKEIHCDLVIIQIGYLAAKETFNKLNIRLKSDESIAIDSYYETSRHGIFAIGDVHGDIKLITVAWAEGIQAAIYAFKEISSPYWLNEKRLKDQRITLIGEKLSEAAGKIMDNG